MKRSTLVTIAVIVAIGAMFFYMTTAKASQECTVCMEFRGLRNCATAVAPTEEQAREGAQTTACGPIASGMDQTIACGRTPPATLQCRTR